MLSSTEHELLAALHARTSGMKRSEKTKAARETAAALGCSVSSLYRKRKNAGYADDKRKQRSDARSSLLSEEELRLAAGIMLASANAKGQYMPETLVLEVMDANGQLRHRVSAGTLNRQLHMRRMHPAEVSLPAPSIELRSLHAGHVSQCDSTTGAYYYLPGGRLRWMPEDEFYKNKIHNLVKASSDLLTRYAWVDHTSHAFKVRYYLGGETTENLLDFVCWAIWKQDSSPLHGVPQILMMDPGAANRGQVMRNFCKRMGIDLRHHAAGAARVTGSVEKAHDLVRMHFETRLRFVDPRQVNLDWLNQLVARWAASYCSTARHTRHGATRYGKWMEISRHPGALRVPASLEAMQNAAVREPETRRVSNNRTVTFGKKDRVYDLALVPGVVAGLRVTVVENPFRSPAVDVLFVDPDTGEETWHVVEPLVFDDNGYRLDSAVIGQEMRIAAHSDVDRLRTALTKQAYKTGDGLPTLEEAARARKAHAQAYAGVVDAMADVNATQVPTYLPRTGTVIGLPERRVEARRLNRVEALQLIMARIGAAYTPQVREDLIARWPDGVPEDEIDGFCAALTQPADDGQASALRLIGGGAA